ncbi:MAG TPA: AlgP family protein [Pseudomonas sp.]|nr:AlgP family protein [Pseudomonas sp.]
MANRNKPVTTPLHLLQQLSHSLLEHLEQACSQAMVDAEKLLAKLEKQRGKAQDKLHKASARLEDAATAGKAKAQAKARASIAELEELLDTLKQRQAETRDYILRLKSDAEQSLHLAQGVGKVKEAVSRLLVERDTASAKPTTAKPRAPRRPRVAAPAAATSPAKPSRTRRASATPAAAEPAAGSAVAPSAPAAPASPRQPATPRGARKPAAAKPAAPAPASGKDQPAQD